MVGLAHSRVPELGNDDGGPARGHENEIFVFLNPGEGPKSGDRKREFGGLPHFIGFLPLTASSGLLYCLALQGHHCIMLKSEVPG